MSQRVNIQYSIDLERVPDEIKSMMSYSLMRLSELNDLFTKMNADVDEKITNGDYVNVLSFIHELRKSIADIDYRLDDCTGLVTAHQGYLVSQLTPEEPNQQPLPEHAADYHVSPHATQAADINEIEEKMSKLKSMVESAGSDE